jgi:pilus assembly protein CpaE
MPFNVLLADADQTSARWLKTLLDREKFDVAIVPSVAAVFKRVSQAQTDVLVTEITLADGDGLDMIRRLRGDPTTRDLYVILLSAKGKPEDIVNGLQAGANDYIPKRPGAEAELIGKIRALMARSNPTAQVSTPPSSRAQILSFCSAKGGTGTTSVCTNIAYALAQLEPAAEIAVIDMVLPFGTAGLLLGIELPKTIAQLTQASIVDRETVQQYVSQKSNWGFHFLLGANEPQEAAEMDVSKLPKIFQTLREMFDYILIDFGRGLSRISLPVIETSTGVVVIATPDLGAVRATRPLLKYLETRGVALDRIFLITNRTMGRMWTTSDEVEKTIGIKPHATIPYAVESMTVSINETVPFMAKFPDHAASTALAGIAHVLQDKFRQKRS